jgi:hypothetical protein
VTRLSAELAASGLLRESSQAAGPKAVVRPHVPVEIDTSRWIASKLHISTRYSTLALLDLRGDIITQGWLPHLETGPRQMISRWALAWPPEDG